MVVPPPAAVPFAGLVDDDEDDEDDEEGDVGPEERTSSCLWNKANGFHRCISLRQDVGISPKMSIPPSVTYRGSDDVVLLALLLLLLVVSTVVAISISFILAQPFSKPGTFLIRETTTKKKEEPTSRVVDDLFGGGGKFDVLLLPLVNILKMLSELANINYS